MVRFVLIFSKTMKPTLKDAQMTIRISGEVLEQMKKDAADLNISLAEFVLRMYHERQNYNDNFEKRISMLENAVFKQSQAA